VEAAVGEAADLAATFLGLAAAFLGLASF